MPNFGESFEKKLRITNVVDHVVLAAILLVGLSGVFGKDNTPDFGPNAPAIKMTNSGGKLILEQAGKSYSVELSQLKPEQIEKLKKLNPDFESFLGNGPIKIIDVKKGSKN